MGRAEHYVNPTKDPNKGIILPKPPASFDGWIEIVPFSLFSVRRACW
jgi:hypothetical protein